MLGRQSSIFDVAKWQIPFSDFGLVLPEMSRKRGSMAEFLSFKVERLPCPCSWQIQMQTKVVYH